jgi:hypothetical protein
VCPRVWFCLLWRRRRGCVGGRRRRGDGRRAYPQGEIWEVPLQHCKIIKAIEGRTKLLSR